MMVKCAAARDTQAEKAGKPPSELFCLCRRISILFQPEQIQFCISHLLEESQLQAVLAKKKSHYTLHGEAVPIFRKYCKLS